MEIDERNAPDRFVHAANDRKKDDNAILKGDLNPRISEYARYLVFGRSRIAAHTATNGYVKTGELVVQSHALGDSATKPNMACSIETADIASGARKKTHARCTPKAVNAQPGNAGRRRC